jgi:plasmid stabilization system protein ParE
VRHVRLEPEAREEFLAAVEWYQERSAAVARRFVDEVDRGLNEIRSNPESWPLAPHVPENLQVRRILLRKFPYALVFLLLDDEIRVLAIAHGRRLPGYWRSRG